MAAEGLAHAKRAYEAGSRDQQLTADTASRLCVLYHADPALAPHLRPATKADQSDEIRVFWTPAAVALIAAATAQAEAKRKRRVA